jgi:hypothetical protein
MKLRFGQRAHFGRSDTVARSAKASAGENMKKERIFVSPAG